MDIWISRQGTFASTSKLILQYCFYILQNKDINYELRDCLTIIRFMNGVTSFILQSDSETTHLTSKVCQEKTKGRMWPKLERQRLLVARQPLVRVLRKHWVLCPIGMCRKATHHRPFPCLFFWVKVSLFFFCRD